MILLAACFPIETRWVKPSPVLRRVRVPMGSRAADGLSDTLGKEKDALLISAGFSGGLVESLRTGDLVLAESIDHNSERIAIDPALLERASRALRELDRRIVRGPTACADQVVSSPDHKRRLGAAGPIAVDMESGPLARWATDRGLPFLSLRVVLDPVDRTLPFSPETPIWRACLRHPLRTLPVGWIARRAGRVLGDGINAVVQGYEVAR